MFYFGTPYKRDMESFSGISLQCTGECLYLLMRNWKQWYF